MFRRPNSRDWRQAGDIYCGCNPSSIFSSTGKNPSSIHPDMSERICDNELDSNWLTTTAGLTGWSSYLDSCSADRDDDAG